MKPPSEVGHTVTRAVGRYMSQESLSSLLHDWNATDDAIKRMEEIRSCSDRGEDGEESGGWMEIPDEGDDRTEVYFHETDGGIYVRVWKGRE